MYIQGICEASKNDIHSLKKKTISLKFYEKQVQIIFPSKKKKIYYT